MDFSLQTIVLWAVPVVFAITLHEAAHVYDLRTEQYLGLTNRIVFKLDGWRPSLFALLKRADGQPGIVKRLEETQNSSVAGGK